MATSGNGIAWGIRKVADALEDDVDSTTPPGGPPDGRLRFAPATPEKHGSKAIRLPNGRSNGGLSPNSRWAGFNSSSSEHGSARQGARDAKIQGTLNRVDINALSPMCLDGKASRQVSLAKPEGLQAVGATGLKDKGMLPPRSGSSQDRAASGSSNLDVQQALGGSKLSTRASSLSLGRMIPWLKKRPASQQPGTAQEEKESKLAELAEIDFRQAELEPLQEEVVTPLHRSADSRRRAALHSSGADDGRYACRKSNAFSEVTIASAVGGGAASRAGKRWAEPKDPEFSFQAPRPRVEQKAPEAAPAASEIWVKPSIPTSAFAAVLHTSKSDPFPSALPRENDLEWRWTGPYDDESVTDMSPALDEEPEDNEWKPAPIEQSIGVPWRADSISLRPNPFEGVPWRADSTGLRPNPFEGYPQRVDSIGLRSQPSEGYSQRVDSIGLRSQPSLGLPQRVDSIGMRSQPSEGYSQRVDSIGLRSQPSWGLSQRVDSIGMRSQPSEGYPQRVDSIGLRSQPSWGLPQRVDSIGMHSQPSEGYPQRVDSIGLRSQPSWGLSQRVDSIGLSSQPSGEFPAQTKAELKRALLKELSAGFALRDAQPAKEARESPKSAFAYQWTPAASSTTSLEEPLPHGSFKGVVAPRATESQRSHRSASSASLATSLRASSEGMSRRGSTAVSISPAASLSQPSRRGSLRERLLSPRATPGSPTISMKSSRSSSSSSSSLSPPALADEDGPGLTRWASSGSQQALSGSASSTKLLLRSPAFRQKRSCSYSSKDSSFRGESPRPSAVPQEDDLAVDSIIKDSLGAALEPVEANPTIHGSILPAAAFQQTSRQRNMLERSA